MDEKRIDLKSLLNERKDANEKISALNTLLAKKVDRC